LLGYLAHRIIVWVTCQQ